ncbi:MAG TPA: phospholipase D family protein [Polyangiales bacterium]|nr:phospholipase D family protein [Polyangiales bacterium]
MSKPILITSLVLFGSILLASGLVLALGLGRLPPRGQAANQAALPPGSGSWLDRIIGPRTDARPGESAFRLISDGVEAFALRALSARHAARSLDVQYYIWHADTTGILLIQELLRAADRGVRVRVLLDDLDARAKNFELVAIDAHPNIEVRIYNPFASRDGFAGKILEGITSFSRINRRMHNKAWIADNRVAIAGGRNIGDEYFTASERVNFVDLDFGMIGPAVQDMSEEFDEYWNSAAVWPMAALSPPLVKSERFETLRREATERVERAARSEYVRALASSDLLQNLGSEPDDVVWSSDVQVLFDDPLKAHVEGDALARSSVLRALVEMLHRAERSATLVSAYFVPGERGTEVLTGLARQGVKLSILTNSLAATDVIAVHGGYAKYRDALIASGAELWELKPNPAVRPHAGLIGSSSASLHTKAVIIDDEQLFVGSFNLDPRSSSLNCEQGVMVSAPALAKQAAELFARMRSDAHAWRVAHDDAGKLAWHDQGATLASEPAASFGRLALARLLRWLPIESQL